MFEIKPEDIINFPVNYFCFKLQSLMARKTYAQTDGREFRKHLTTYLSPRSQTECVSLLGEEVRKEISNRVKKASFCSVMADTTPDVSHSDELSVALRFINTDTFEPEERFVNGDERQNGLRISKQHYQVS